MHQSCSYDAHLPPLQVIGVIISPINCFAPVASCYFWTKGRTKFSAASLMGVRMMGLQSLLHIHEGERRDFFHKGVVLHKLSTQLLRDLFD